MKKGFLSFFLFTAFALALCPSCKDDETAEWKNVAFSVASNLAPENGTIPYEGSTVVFTVTTDGKWTYAIDQSKTDWFTHPTVDGMTLAILIPGKHREQGALRRSPVHLGLGPHAGRGVHHHAGTRTCAARSAESRPARRCLPRRRHGRGRIAAQERGALLPRHGADLLLPRRLQAHRDQLHAHPGAGFPQGFLLPGGLLHERDVQAGSGRRPHAGGRPAFEPQRRHEGVQALLGA